MTISFALMHRGVVRFLAPARTAGYEPAAPDALRETVPGTAEPHKLVKSGSTPDPATNSGMDEADGRAVGDAAPISRSDDSMPGLFSRRPAGFKSASSAVFSPAKQYNVTVRRLAVDFVSERAPGERRLLIGQILKLAEGGELLRAELERLTVEELDGVLRTLVNAIQEEWVEGYREWFNRR